MSSRVEQAIERLRALPESQQEELARFLLSELDEDERWAATTRRHLDGLGRLCDRVLADDTRGECDLLDPDKL